MSRYRVVKRALIAVGLAGLLLPLLALAYFAYLFDWNRARDPLGARASDSLGRKIVIHGDLRPDLSWPVVHLTARDIEVANMASGSEPAMLTLDTLDVGIDLRGFLRGKLEFTEIVLLKPRLLLEKTMAGEANWNFATNPAGATALALVPESREEFPLIGRLAIRDGRLRYKDPARKTALEIRAASLDGKAEDERAITLKGDGVVEGQSVRFQLDAGSVSALRRTQSPYPISGELSAGDTSASIKGTVIDPVAFKGVDLKLRIEGRNAADLFPLTGIALLPTPPYRVAGRLQYSADMWSFEKFTGRMGDSDLAGSLKWDRQRPRPVLTGRIISQRLAFKDLGPFIGTDTEPADERVLPDAPLKIDRLAAMDADVEFTGVRIVATKLPLDDFYAHFVLRDRVLRIVPISFSSGNGDIAARMTIDSKRKPVRIDGKFEMTKVPLSPLFEKAAAVLDAPNLATGVLDGKAGLRGTGESVRDWLSSADGTVDVRSGGGTLSHLIVELIGLDVAESVGFLLKGDTKVPIRCVVGDFTVKQGQMRPRVLVIDTDDTIITGEGTIDLATEQLKLRLHPEPKDFSPFSLRSPLAINGTMKHPKITVRKRGLIARGVAAAALAFVFPPAIVAAFLEPGLGEDSECQALLASPKASSGAADGARD
ncbi:MAG: AsmA family protein [Gammaproteobacteria bacterium]